MGNVRSNSVTMLLTARSGRGHRFRRRSVLAVAALMATWVVTGQVAAAETLVLPTSEPSGFVVATDTGTPTYTKVLGTDIGIVALGSATKAILAVGFFWSGR